MKTFCVMFDAEYAFQALALMSSIQSHITSKHFIRILALDDYTIDIAERIPSPSFEVVTLEHLIRIEPRLIEARKNRTWREFCWTVKSVFLRWCMQRDTSDVTTYLDADLFFFDDPEICFGELGDKILGIVPHRFPPQDKGKEVNGIFNAGAIFARQEALPIIEEWVEQCLDGCKDTATFTDQIYLDAWPKRLGEKLHIFDNVRVGVAPWNILSYAVDEGPCIQDKRIVFYHFHEINYTKPEKLRLLTHYKLRETDMRFVYQFYFKVLDMIYRQVSTTYA